ncbi:hypothetical protein KUV57_11275 [Epibacterium sp. DP7N7-1]|nr:hypothetical protein [Epibacterium sp. DP7N7-1]
MGRSKADIRRFKLERDIPNMWFIDIEASDGGPDAMPIEIGFARIAVQDGERRTYWGGSLIKPDPNWTQIWSPHAERIHGIPRSALETAQPARMIAQNTFSHLSSEGRIVVSDSPRNDQPWLDRLLSTIGKEGQIRIISVWEALNGRVEQNNLVRMKEWLRENKAPHRAGPDAARLAQSVIDCHLDPPDPEPEMLPEP